MKITTWNVNSLFARLPAVQRYLRESSPDILLLQELKTNDADKVIAFFEDCGYGCAVFGQKSYNGVAIASKFMIEDTTCGLPGFDDEQARYIEAFTGGYRVASVYAPNGQDLASEKFLYKLDFFAALHERLQHLQSLDEAVVVGGDFNVAPQKIDTPSLQTPEELHTSLKERRAFRNLLSGGYVDILRETNPSREQWFSWWDYRSGAWTQNKGLRIDHILTSSRASDLVQSCGIDSFTRGWEKPSDHAPVWLTLT